MGQKLKLKGWPTAETSCRVCGEKIIYFRYHDREKKKRRRAPVTHNGECALVWQRRKAEKKIKSYKRRLKKKENR